MFAVIPHPTEALILSHIQKATLSHLNAETGEPCWIPLFPLWAFFNNFDYSAAAGGRAKKKQTQNAQSTGEAYAPTYTDAASLQAHDTVRTNKMQCALKTDKPQSAQHTDTVFQQTIKAQIAAYTSRLQSSPRTAAKHPRDENLMSESRCVQAERYDDSTGASSGSKKENSKNVNVPFGAPQLKTIRNAIASFTVGTPEVSNGEFFFPAVLRFQNGEAACGKILAGKKCGKRQTDDMKRGVSENFNADNGTDSSCSHQNESGESTNPACEAGNTHCPRNANDSNVASRSNRCNENEESHVHSYKLNDADASTSCAAESGKNAFTGFPRSFIVFRIADAEIGERKAANDENASDKVAVKRTKDIPADTGKCIEETSALHGNIGDAELRTWRVFAAIWVKTERIQS